jgi:putative ABC transport system permease protein
MMSPFGSSALLALFRRTLRLQRRSIGATALIVTTLALALGANTAVLSVADALLLRAVPFADPERLVAVNSSFPTMKLGGMNLSGPEALEFAQLTRAFASTGPYTFTGLVVQGGGEAELASGVQISKGAVEAFGVRPVSGRPFADADYLPGGPSVALLGHGLWKRAFGGDPAIVGRVVQLGGVSREVIGVMPDGLSILNRPVDVWLPLQIDAGSAGSRSDHRFNVVARLAPGRSFKDAVDDVTRAMSIWREETGEMHTPHREIHPLSLERFTSATTGLNREPIGALVGAVAFVLLIACANISNLLLARAEHRRGEVAIQLALGASRRRLLGESILEGLVLASAGGIGGLLISQLIVDLLRASWPAIANATLTLDYRILLTTAAVTTVAGVVIGTIPILRLDAARASDALKSGSRGAGGTAGRLRLQKALIASQIALAVLLAGGAGLMVRSLVALTAIDIGFDAGNVTRLLISLPAGSYPDDPQVWSFYDRVLERVRAIPGVSHAAAMSGLPPLRRANNTSFMLDGVEMMDHRSIHQVEFVQHVTPEYLPALRIRLREGRNVSDTDTDRAPTVALVNETLAKQFWPNESAIGHRLKPAGNIGTWFTVVGVVADVRQNGLQSAPASEMYVPYRQARLLMNGFMPRTMNLVVRSTAESAAVVNGVRTAVTEVDPSAAISGIASMQTIVDRTIAQPRLLAWMFSALATLALVVAGVGVYAVTSYVVGTRTAEFGVRIALGATPRDVMGLVVASGAWTIAAGLIVGSLAALGSARLLANLLFSVTPLDPPSLAAGAIAMAGASIAATILPAVRAARVDPVTALRD